jgi:hypothetical protein
VSRTAVESRNLSVSSATEASLFAMWLRGGLVVRYVFDLDRGVLNKKGSGASARSKAPK